MKPRVTNTKPTVTSMKTIKYLSTLLCLAALFAGASLVRAEEAPKKKACGCCEATTDAGKACKEKCCVKAAEKGKVCKKCHPDTGDKAK